MIEVWYTRRHMVELDIEVETTEYGEISNEDLVKINKMAAKKTDNPFVSIEEIYQNDEMVYQY